MLAHFCAANFLQFLPFAPFVPFVSRFVWFVQSVPFVFRFVPFVPFVSKIVQFVLIVLFVPAQKCVVNDSTLHVAPILSRFGFVSSWGQRGEPCDPLSILRDHVIQVYVSM